MVWVKSRGCHSRMGTPRVTRSVRGSHLRAAVVDLVGVDPVAVDNDAAELLGRAAHALSVDEGRELAGERLRSALVEVFSLRRAVSSFARVPRSLR